MPYLDEPVGRVKIQTTSKNSQRYYTTKCLIRDLLSNTPNFYVRAGEFRGYLFTGNAWQKYAKRNGIGAGNPAKGKLVFVVSTTPSLAQFTSLFTTGKKSSFDWLNYRSIQVFHFKISVKKKRRKEIPIDKQFFSVAWIKFVACALRENLPNRSSRVQIPRDICTRLERYLYSTKWSWIIKSNIWRSFSNWSLIISQKCMVTPNFFFGYHEYLLRSTFSG